MGENGIVISKNKEMLNVSMNRNAACSKCKACIAGLNENEMIITAKNMCGADIGDKVVIELKNENFIKAVLIMYGIPCVFFIIGVFIGQLTNWEPAGLIIGAALVFAVYFFIKKNERFFNKADYIPTAVNLAEAKQ